MVKKYAAARWASGFAKESNEQANPKSASDYIKYQKAIIEFQILSLQSELNLLEELAAMSDEEKMDVLFSLMDKDKNGVLSAVELADGLRKIRGNVDFEESLALAVEQVVAFDTNNDGVLDRNEFQTLVDTILPLLGCSFHELSEILALQVIFSETGNTPMENAVAQVLEDEITEEITMDDGLRRAMKDRRMKALFNVFDDRDEGAIDFKEVVVGMYKLMEDIDEASHAAVTALLLFDKEEKRELQYKDFCRLMLNVVASSPENITFDDVADTLTRNAIDTSSGVTSSYVMEQFSMDKESKLLLNIADDEELISLTVVELAKMERLFEMFDLDHDNKISAKDLALGLAKFHDSVGMNQTLEETKQVMKTFDKSADGKLSKEEFAKFIVNFASTTNHGLVDFLDFMIVVSALKENTEAQKEYVDSIKEGDGTLDYRYG